jgi:hypothetical protein
MNCQTVGGLLMWSALSDERSGLSFRIAAGSSQLLFALSVLLVIQFLGWPLFSLLLTWPPLSCHDLLRYCCDYSEHFVQRRIVCIRSLNWLTCYLLVVPLWRGRPVQLRTAEAAAVAVCCCVASPRRWKIFAARFEEKYLSWNAGTVSSILRSVVTYGSDSSVFRGSILYCTCYKIYYEALNIGYRLAREDANISETRNFTTKRFQTSILIASEAT